MRRYRCTAKNASTRRPSRSRWVIDLDLPAELSCRATLLQRRGAPTTLRLKIDRPRPDAES